MKGMNIYKIPLRVVDDVRVTKEKLEQLRANTAYRDLIQRLEDIVASERDLYESTVADEYKRGRLNALTDLLVELSGS